MEEENVIITKQSPIEGVNVNKGSKIYVEY